MFRGQFAHTLDPKGRISVPSRFRAELLAGGDDQPLIVTPAPFDACLHVYPLAAWESFERKVAELPSMDPNIVRFRRIYVSAACECEVDKAHRFLIPPQLRQKAGLERDVLFAGMGPHIELWSQANWDAALTLSPADEAEFKAAVLEQIKI